ncbi:MAG: hypothetical protein LBF41_08215 [Deltaproteobacteria bacterium]|jgi:hypothetical protein|nr:hypothetical protein [Deltaproteobacteria bacterium]
MSLLLVLLPLSCTLAAPKTNVATGSDPSRGSPEALKLANDLFLLGDGLKTFGVRGEATYRSGKNSSTYRFELVAEKPDTYSFTVLVFGTPALRAVSDGKIFKLFDYASGVSREGPAGDDSLLSRVPVPLDPETFLNVFSGSLPEAPSRAQALTALPSTVISETVFDLASGDPGKTLRVAVRGGPDYSEENPPKIESILFIENGKTTLNVSYGDYRLHSREDRDKKLFPFPGSLVLSWKDGSDKTLTVKYEEVNSGFLSRPGRFDLETPPGFRVMKF